MDLLRDTLQFHRKWFSHGKDCIEGPVFAQDEQGDSDEQAYIVWFPRGDGTKGHYGGVSPTAVLAQTEWLINDQKARRSLLDDDLSQSETLFKQAIQRAESKGMYEPGVINSFCGLAFLYHKKSNSAESERLYEYAMRYLEGVTLDTNSLYVMRMTSLLRSALK